MSTMYLNFTAAPNVAKTLVKREAFGNIKSFANLTNQTKPFKCDDCPEVFCSTEELKRHHG